MTSELSIYMDLAGKYAQALRDIIERVERRSWETHGHPMNEWTKRDPILRIAREALEYRPPGGSVVAAGVNPEVGVTNIGGSTVSEYERAIAEMRAIEKGQSS